MDLQENARLGLKQCSSMSRENDKNKEALKESSAQRTAFYLHSIRVREFIRNFLQDSARLDWRNVQCQAGENKTLK